MEAFSRRYILVSSRFPAFFIFLSCCGALIFSMACSPITERGGSDTLAPSRALEAKKNDAAVTKTVKEGAARVEKLLVELSEARQANKLDPEDLGKSSFAVSVTWVGELEPVVKDLAASCGMGFRIIGRPTSPILVSIEVSDMLILEVFRILGMQAGTRADIIYRSFENIIEIVYAEK